MSDDYSTSVILLDTVPYMSYFKVRLVQEAIQTVGFVMERYWERKREVEVEMWPVKYAFFPPCQPVKCRIQVKFIIA